MHIESKSAKIDTRKLIRALEALPDRHAEPFSLEEKELIKKYVPLKGVRKVATVLGKTYGRVRNCWRLVRDARECKTA